MLTQRKLQDLFDYRNGNLYRRTTVSNTGRIGDKAGCTKDKGYIYVGIDNKEYLLHRLIFLHQKGYLPNSIDHRDTDKTNNNIDNLRECTLSQNKMNTPTQPNNKSGTRGVHFCNRSKTWVAKIKIEGKTKHILASKNKQEAIDARRVAEKIHFGDFLYNGK